MPQKQLIQDKHCKTKDEIEVEVTRLGEELQRLKSEHHGQFGSRKLADPLWSTDKFKAFVKNQEYRTALTIKINALQWVLCRRGHP